MGIQAIGNEPTENLRVCKINMSLWDVPSFFEIFDRDDHNSNQKRKAKITVVKKKNIQAQKIDGNQIWYAILPFYYLALSTCSRVDAQHLGIGKCSRIAMFGHRNLVLIHS